MDEISRSTFLTSNPITTNYNLKESGCDSPRAAKSVDSVMVSGDCNIISFNYGLASPEKSGKESPPLPKTIDVDFCKVALLNSMQQVKMPNLSLKKSTSMVSNLESSSSSDSERRDVFRSPLPPSPIASPPVALFEQRNSSYELGNTKSQNRIFKVIDKRCKSLSHQKRKPFDLTEKEEQIEQIFKNFNKPLKKHMSFECELFADHLFEEDNRLNASCALDYTTEAGNYKPNRLRRVNSLELIYIHPEETQNKVKPKKYVLEIYF